MMSNWASRTSKTIIVLDATDSFKELVMFHKLTTKTKCMLNATRKQEPTINCMVAKKIEKNNKRKKNKIESNYM
jgi:hypothetical protein